MQRIRIWWVVVIAIALGAAGVLGLNWRHLMIAYHKHGMISARAQILELKRSGKGMTSKEGRLIKAEEDHRAALVELGYLQRLTVHLNHISVPSKEAEELWNALIDAMLKDEPIEGEYDRIARDVHMYGWNEGVSDMVIIWDRPEKMEQYMRIIEAHYSLKRDDAISDRAENRSIDEAKNEAESIVPSSQAITAYLGTWEDAEGNLAYRIRRRDDGSAVIVPPDNPVWELKITNARFEGKHLTFDEHLSFTNATKSRWPMNSIGKLPSSVLHVTLMRHGESPQKIFVEVKSQDGKVSERTVLHRK